MTSFEFELAVICPGNSKTSRRTHAWRAKPETRGPSRPKLRSHESLDLMKGLYGDSIPKGSNVGPLWVVYYTLQAENKS